MARQAGIQSTREINIQRIQSKPLNTAVASSFSIKRDGHHGTTPRNAIDSALLTPTEEEKTADFRKRIGCYDSDESPPQSPPELANSYDSSPVSPKSASLDKALSELPPRLVPTPDIPHLSLTPDETFGSRSEVSRAEPHARKTNPGGPPEVPTKWSHWAAIDNWDNWVCWDENWNVLCPPMTKEMLIASLKLQIPGGGVKYTQDSVICSPKPDNAKEKAEEHSKFEAIQIDQTNKAVSRAHATLESLTYDVVEKILHPLLKQEKNMPIPVNVDFEEQESSLCDGPFVDYSILHASPSLYEIGLPIYYSANVWSIDLDDISNRYFKRFDNWPEGFAIDMARQHVDKIVLRCQKRLVWTHVVRVLRAFTVGTGPNGTNRSLKSVCIDARDCMTHLQVERVYETDGDEYKDGRATPQGINNHPEGDWVPESNRNTPKDRRGQWWECRRKFAEVEAPWQMRKLLERAGVTIERPEKGRGMVAGRLTIANTSTTNMLGPTGYVARAVFPQMKEGCLKLGYRLGDGKESYYNENLGGWRPQSRFGCGTWA